MIRGGTSRYARTVGLAVWFVVQLWWLKHTRRLRGARQEAAASALYTRQARRFVAFAVDMGGLIVKLGQFLSVRIDLLPKEYIDELSQLQDALPAVPTDQIVSVIEAELGRPLDQIYASFDPTPLAAASLGQVHRASLPDGQTVAVKVLRPGIDDLVKTDLRSLRAILRLVDRVTRLSQFMDVADLEADFTTTFSNELDYAKEGQYAEIFQRNLLMNAHVDVPQVFWEYSTHRVLTLEFMDGVRIDDLAAIDAAGIDRHDLAVNLAGVFFEMVLTDGFFHADPHPGNVFVRHDGIIQLIDFGMVGSISPQARQQYTQLILALVRRDAPGIVAALKALGFLGPGADTAKLTDLVGPYIDAVIGDVAGLYTSGGMLSSMMNNPVVRLTFDPAVVAEIQQFILTQPITLPGQTTFLGKALITVLGLCLRLDPDLDILATAAPHVSGDTGWAALRAMVDKALADGSGLLRGAIPTAQHLMSVIQKLDDGSLEVELTRAVEHRLIQARQRPTRQLMAVVAAGFALIAAVLGWRRRG